MSDTGFKLSASRPLAVVTGASSGIGRALALRLARAGYDLALVSRDDKRLGDTARACAQLGVDASVVKEDLAQAGAADRVLAALAARGLGPVDVLVNNAGFGLHGDFARTDLAVERAMIQTHVTALVELTKPVLAAMVARGSGRVLNVGSVYSYAPVPHQAIYGATKAFLLSFSESLNGELAGTGVTVTAVLPGITRTEFRERAGIVSKRLRGMTPEAVAEASFDGMMAGRRVVVPGLANKIFVGLARALPVGLFSALMRAINRYRGLSSS